MSLPAKASNKLPLKKFLSCFVLAMVLRRWDWFVCVGEWRDRWWWTLKLVLWCFSVRHMVYFLSYLFLVLAAQDAGVTSIFQILWTRPAFRSFITESRGLWQHSASNSNYTYCKTTRGLRKLTYRHEARRDWCEFALTCCNCWIDLGTSIIKVLLGLTIPGGMRISNTECFIKLFLLI